ncbi:MAG: BspA family leucine-rich repeat surface protein [Coriobacteriales bacterium]|nr:BspA family leucine-rich repeat surface protein [Coriobacteriales bacterium]
MSKGSSGSLYDDDILRGYNYLLKVKTDAATKDLPWVKNLKIASMSFGGYGYDSSDNNAIQNIYNAGIAVFAATGNDAAESGWSETMMHYPSAYEHVNGIGSIQNGKTRSYFSNYGSYVDLCAPGSSIYSTVPGGTYANKSGTSMATPFAAGCAALITANNPDITVDELNDLLIRTAEDLGPADWDKEYGYGLIRPDNALKDLPQPSDIAKGDLECISGEAQCKIYEDGRLIISGGGVLEPFTNNHTVWYDYRDSITTVKMPYAVCPSSYDYFFANLEKLTDISQCDFNCELATSAYQMFNGCKQLEDPNLSKLDTSHFTNMQQMFCNCNNLTTIDISFLDFTNVENIKEMFFGDSQLQTIYSNDDLSSYSIMDSENMFYNCSALPNYDPAKLDITNAKVDDGSNGGYFKLPTIQDTYEANEPSSAKAIVYQNGLLAFEGTGEFAFDYDIIEDADGAVDYFKYPWTEDYASNIVAVKFSNGSKPTNLDYYFKNFTNLCVVNSKNIDLSACTGLDSTFEGCGMLHYVDFSSKSSDTLEDMAYTFYNCSSLHKLLLNDSSFENVTTIRSFCNTCSNLSEINTTNFSCPNLEVLRVAFGYCSKIESLDLSSLGTENVEEFNALFIYDEALKSVNVSSFDTANGTNFSNMFDGCKALESLDIENFVVSDKALDLSFMFQDCSKIQTLNLSNFSTENVETFSGMFSACSSLESLNLSSFNTSNCTDFSGMFSGASSLLNLDLLNFDTSNAIDFSYMFETCRSLTSLDLRTWTTENAEKFNGMFFDCTKITADNKRYDGLKTLNLRNFNPTKATSFDQMFAYDAHLVTIYATNNWANVMSSSAKNSCTAIFMFCGSLTGGNGKRLYDIDLDAIMGMGTGWFGGRPPAEYCYPSKPGEDSSIGMFTYVNPPDINYALYNPINDHTYTGSEITIPNFNLYRDEISDDHKLTAGEDYSYTYTNNVNVGTAKIQVTGLGEYASTSTEITFNIIPKKVTVKPNDNSKYRSEADPNPITTTKEITGLIGTDAISYTFTRKAGEDKGEYPITVVGDKYQGNYELVGTEATFTIKTENINVKVNNAEKYRGDSNPTFSASFEDDNGDSVPSSIVNTLSYTLSCDATTDSEAGVYDINVVGDLEQGKYSLKPIKGILTINVIEVTVTPNAPSAYTYGDTVAPFTATVEGLLPSESIEFDLWTDANKNTLNIYNAGVYTIYSGKDPNGGVAPDNPEKQGKYNVTFQTTQLTINKATPNINWDTANDTIEITQKISNYDNEKQEIANPTDSSQSFELDCNIDGSIPNYQIKASSLQDSIANAQITKQDPTAAHSHLCKVSSNLVGSTTITIYTEENANYLACSKQFSVNVVAAEAEESYRLNGDGRYQTMRFIVEKSLNKTFENSIVIARGDDFPDALAASALAGLLEGSVVLTNTNTLNDEAKQTIKKIQPSKAYIIGGTNSINELVKTQLLAISSITSVTRIKGDSRTFTSFEIYKYVKNHPSEFKHTWFENSTNNKKTCIVTTGVAFADALSVSSYAYTKNVPIFLTESNGKLNSTIKAAIANDGFERIIILGSTKSVDSDIEASFPAICDPRWAGKNRYETCSEIVNHSLSEGLNLSCVSFAQGDDFPDALAASCLSGCNKSIIILVPNNSSPSQSIVAMEKIGNQYKHTLTNPFIMGSSTSLTDASKAKIDAWYEEAKTY